MSRRLTIRLARNPAMTEYVRLVDAGLIEIAPLGWSWIGIAATVAVIVWLMKTRKEATLPKRRAVPIQSASDQTKRRAIPSRSVTVQAKRRAAPYPIKRPTKPSRARPNQATNHTGPPRSILHQAKRLVTPNQAEPKPHQTDPKETNR